MQPATHADKTPLKTLATAYISTLVAVGCIGSALVVFRWESSDPWRFIVYVLAAVLSSGLKIHLPGIKGTLSVNFLFILLATIELSWSETVATSVLSFVLQYIWRGKSKPQLIKVG